MRIEGYKLFRKNIQGRKGGGIALYIREGIYCEELSLRNRHRQVKSLWES